MADGHSKVTDSTGDLSTLFLILRDLREEQMVLLELEEGLHLLDEDFWELGKTLQIFMT